VYVYTVIWSNIFTAIYKKFVVLSEMHELHLINKLFKVLYTDTVSCVHVARQSWLRLVRCFCMLVPDLCLNPIDWTGFLNAQFTEAWLACPQAYRVVCQSPLWWHGPLGWDVIRLSLRFRDYGWRITTPQTSINWSKTKIPSMLEPTNPDSQIMIKGPFQSISRFTGALFGGQCTRHAFITHACMLCLECNIW